ncbi:MAG: hypothetical protein QOF61_2961 [Acidobacteriota bacterium]|jgi:hypothetical protein|nr:hypothetical protein [Acidobacteriota bacterium]
MLKGIKIPATGNLGSTHNAEEVKLRLKTAFEKVNPGMTLDSSALTLNSKGDLGGQAYIRGEQVAPANFESHARQALAKAIEQLRQQLGLPTGPQSLFALAKPADDLRIEALQNQDEDEGVIEPPLLPKAKAGKKSAASKLQAAARPKIEFLFEEPEEIAAKAALTAAPSHKAAKPASDFAECPPSGDGGDPQLNVLKNRKKKGAWREVTIQKMLDLDWPADIERRQRSNWSSDNMAQVHKNEVKGALRIEGWLAGAKAEGEESCNCHSPTEVDYHLWVVDAPEKASKSNRFQSVVCEVTPRVRAGHKKGWDITRIAEVVKTRTKVRLSGWLLMDQEHPEQLPRPQNENPTRGSLWEIHPIIKFEVKQGGKWVRLEDAKL